MSNIDDEMTIAEIARFFGINKKAAEPKEMPTPAMMDAKQAQADFVKSAEQERVKAMSLEEASAILKEENLADLSNDIYKISARVKNQARMTGGNLTENGVMMCNVYTHVLKSLYTFAEKLPDNLKNEYVTLLRSHENMPGNLIVALQNNLRVVLAAQNPEIVVPAKKKRKYTKKVKKDVKQDV